MSRGACATCIALTGEGLAGGLPRLDGERGGLLDGLRNSGDSFSNPLPPSCPRTLPPSSFSSEALLPEPYSALRAASESEEGRVGLEEEGLKEGWSVWEEEEEECVAERCEKR